MWPVQHNPALKTTTRAGWHTQNCLFLDRKDVAVLFFHVCCSRSEDAQQQSWDKALLWASPWEFSTEPVKDLPHRHPGARREDSSSAETQVKQLVNCLDVLWPQRTVMPELY